MNSTKLEQSWKVTIGYLQASYSLLPKEMPFEEAVGFREDYLDFLKHNELELAMNSLDDLGILCNVPNQYWKQLELAATNMELFSEAERFKKIQST